MVPLSTIRDRMLKKDLRFERAAGTAFEQRPKTLTHEERQELIRRPITFHTYGSKGWGGTTINQPQVFGDGSRGSTSPDDDSDNR